ncbi:hypothetical protein EEL31_10455 [Brevibacillus laterosporus]|nr:hypothetical protein [Brevibacillus laterosporus]TPG68910.1 hypothetical protein EEL31_10455 [Brevibacillus laterosporus]
MEKKSSFKLQLNEIKQSEDVTVLPVTFIIHDFEKSWNNQIVSKDVSMSAAHTLLNKPIVAKYYPVTQFNTLTDALGSHEEYLDSDRYGDPAIKTDTVPIGVFTTEGYLLNVNENGEMKEVLAADAILWRSRFGDICDLLLEWYQRGIQIFSSVEFLYKNYSFKDGIEYVESPIYYDAHCLLNAEERNGHKVVEPAYDASKLLSFNDLKQFNRLVAQATHKDKKEGDVMFFKKVCELSHDDIRSKLYNQLSIQMSEQEFNCSYIVDVSENSFVVESWNEDEGSKKYHKMGYSKENEQVIVNFQSKTEVVEERTWTGVSDVEQLKTELNEANEKIGEFTSQINSLKPFKEKHDQIQFENSLNEKKQYFAEKFEAVDAKEKFENEEVQSLIKLSLNSSLEGQEATLKLHSMLVELVKVPKKQEGLFVQEFASKNNNLLPDVSDFESRYSN